MNVLFAKISLFSGYHLQNVFGQLKATIHNCVTLIDSINANFIAYGIEAVSKKLVY